MATDQNPTTKPVNVETVAYYVEREMKDLLERNALLEEIEMLRKALRPLAHIAELVDSGARRMSDDTGLWTRNSTVDGEPRDWSLTMGHARAARDAISNG
jgi:hypothetical protein